ncbi:TasA family protein [Kineococcus sp. SYSU DK006]|uniref:TasA family protein n=1 Tax=Kineococcus sp. SYSU DK006 TaxID=3383127 RepID=UPI003D7CA708
MTTRSKLRRGVATAVVPLGLLAGTAVVVHDSHAAFTTSTSAPGTFTAGNLVLTSSAQSTPFATGAINPGTTDRRCVVVTNGGTTAADVVLHVTDYAAQNGGDAAGTNLEDRLQLTVEAAPGDQSATCTSSLTTPTTLFTGTPKDLSAKNTVAAGLPTSGVAKDGKVTYRITYALANQPDLPDGTGGNNTEMNDSIAFRLTWFARSV